MRKAILSAVLIGICMPAFSAGVYKWTDEDGVVHYSDKKPQNQSTTQLNVRTKASSPSQPSQSLEQQTQQLNDQEELESIRQQQAQANAEAEKIQQERCQAARTNLDTLTTNPRIRIEGEDGQLRFLTPEEILEKRKETQTILDNECQ